MDASTLVKNQILTSDHDGCQVFFILQNLEDLSIKKMKMRKCREVSILPLKKHLWLCAHGTQLSQKYTCSILLQNLFSFTSTKQNLIIVATNSNIYRDFKKGSDVSEYPIKDTFHSA